jgi:hypothetical protein
MKPCCIYLLNENFANEFILELEKNKSRYYTDKLENLKAKLVKDLN